MASPLFWEGKDDLGRDLRLEARPRRIVSLVPSQTELLLDLGARVVGRTRYCVHPEARVAAIPAVGGTKKVDRAHIEALQPDLILAEKEENPRELVEALGELAPVYVTDVVSIPSALHMCREVGKLTGYASEAQTLASRIESEFESVRGRGRPERVLYLIWKKPWMAAGKGTFIGSCLEHIGFQNVVSDRYPELTPEALVTLSPERVLLSSEPYPFKEPQIEELRALLPQARVELVDGELFSWYGSRMLRMPDYWKRIFPRAES